jgi:hypothetical protein
MVIFWLLGWGLRYHRILADRPFGDGINFTPSFYSARVHFWREK